MQKHHEISLHHFETQAIFHSIGMSCNEVRKCKNMGSTVPRNEWFLWKNVRVSDCHDTLSLLVNNENKRPYAKW